MKSRWRTLSGESVPDIVSFVREATKGGQAVHVGTDSLQVSRFTEYVTVVVILNPPNGGRVEYLREVVKRENSLRKRLLEEVWRSVVLGLELQDAVANTISIHVDANVDTRYRSSDYVKELTSLVVSQGFRMVLKPDSWAASHVADWTVRHLGKTKVG